MPLADVYNVPAAQTACAQKLGQLQMIYIVIAQNFDQFTVVDVILHQRSVHAPHCIPHLLKINTGFFSVAGFIQNSQPFHKRLFGGIVHKHIKIIDAFQVVLAEHTLRPDYALFFIAQHGQAVKFTDAFLLGRLIQTEIAIPGLHHGQIDIFFLIISLR